MKPEDVDSEIHRLCKAWRLTESPAKTVWDEVAPNATSRGLGPLTRRVIAAFGNSGPSPDYGSLKILAPKEIDPCLERITNEARQYAHKMTSPFPVFPSEGCLIPVIWIEPDASIYVLGFHDDLIVYRYGVDEFWAVWNGSVVDFLVGIREPEIFALSDPFDAFRGANPETWGVWA